MQCGRIPFCGESSPFYECVKANIHIRWTVAADFSARREKQNVLRGRDQGFLPLVECTAIPIGVVGLAQLSAVCL